MSTRHDRLRSTFVLEIASITVFVLEINRGKKDYLRNVITNEINLKSTEKTKFLAVKLINEETENAKTNISCFLFLPPFILLVLFDSAFFCSFLGNIHLPFSILTDFSFVYFLLQSLSLSLLN